MTTVTLAQVQARRRNLLWRLHFWAALIASPFALIACLTGILYIFTPQIEQSWYKNLDTVEPLPSGVRQLDEVVAAAKQTAPMGWTLHSVIPAFDADDSVRVAFMPPPASVPMASGGGHAGHGGGSAVEAKPQFLRPNFGIPARALVVHVNPYTAEVLGQLQQSERFVNWARKLHSSLLQGDAWRWLIELATSWMMIMLVSGIFLWWPRAGQSGLPEAGARGRRAWGQWHAFVAVLLSVMSLIILTTGLTWSQYAGAQVKLARDATGQTPPRIPAHIKSTPVAGEKPLTWEQALLAIRRQAPLVSMQIMPPKGAEGVWRANQMDKGDPTKRFDLLLDAYTGEALYYSGWTEQTLFGKATAIGIPFHRGEFGLWNQALLFLFGIGILFSLLSGWVMFVKRHRPGASILPPIRSGDGRFISPWAVLSLVLAGVLMPVLAVSAVLPLSFELYWAWQRRNRMETAAERP